MNKIFVVLCLLMCSFITEEAFASFCNKGKFDFWDYLDYTDVFKGTVLSKTSVEQDSVLFDTLSGMYFLTGGYDLIEFAIENTYKGTAADTVILKTSLSNGMNDTKTFNVGDVWYVFSQISTEGFYFVGGCSWSTISTRENDAVELALKLVEKYSSLNAEIVSVKYKDRDCSKKRKAKGLLLNGQAEGYWTFNDNWGRPYMTGYYKNGLPDSLWTDYFGNRYDHALKIVAAKTFIKNGKYATISYSINGEIVYGYIDSNFVVPKGVFSEDEFEYLMKRKHGEIVE